MNYEVDNECKMIKNQIIHFMDIGRYEKVRLLASDLISKNPSSPHAYYAMSFCEFNIGNFDNSIELCLKSLELGMNQEAARIMLMNYYSEKGDFINVDKQYDLIIKLDPSCNDAKAIYGYSLWKRGRSEESVLMLEEALASDTDCSIILEYIFNASKKNRSKKETYKLLELYMNTSASEKRKLLFAGKCEIHAKRLGKAKICFEKMLALDPTDKEALNCLDAIKFRMKVLPLFLICICIVIGIVIYI